MSKLLAGRCVLVVEDEILILVMIEDMLSDPGCEAVFTASSVDQALVQIDAHTFDVAMLDSNLYGQSSDPIAEALAARGVPFFFATGQKSDGMRRGYPDRPVVMKPFNFESLEASFRQMLSATE
jgi:DNA-binding response OmpR family regulator